MCVWCVARHPTSATRMRSSIARLPLTQPPPLASTAALPVCVGDWCVSLAQMLHSLAIGGPRDEARAVLFYYFAAVMTSATSATIVSCASTGRRIGTGTACSGISPLIRLQCAEIMRNGGKILHQGRPIANFQHVTTGVGGGLVGVGCRWRSRWW